LTKTGRGRRAKFKDKSSSGALRLDRLRLDLLRLDRLHNRYGASGALCCLRLRLWSLRRSADQGDEPLGDVYFVALG
jgi:hypothetical protein